MKLISLFFIFAGYTLLAASQLTAQDHCTARGVETTLTIQAPPEKVWAQLVDFEAYPQWHNYLLRIDGKFKEKAYITIYYRDTTGGEGHFRARLLEIRPNASLAWGGSAAFFFRARHYFTLSSPDGLTTTLVQGEYWHGWFGKSFGRKIYRTTYRQFVEMNQRLKARAEAG